MMTKDAILHVYNLRHACKVFDPNAKLSEEDFSFVLETGRLSPSSFGFEPWKFLVVQNMTLREKLKQVTWGAKGSLLTASHFVVILARKQITMKHDSHYITHMMRDVHHLDEKTIDARRAVYKNFLENDFSLLENERATFDWATKQAYIALSNMMTAAIMIGIDSCPIEGFKAKELAQIMADDFGINTDEFGVACMVAFGHKANKNQREKTRQPIEDISQWYH